MAVNGFVGNVCDAVATIECVRMLLVGEYVRLVTAPVSVATSVAVGNEGVRFDFVAVYDDEMISRDAELVLEIVTLREYDCSRLKVPTLRETEATNVEERSDSVSANVRERDTCPRVSVGPDHVNVRDAAIESECVDDTTGTETEPETLPILLSEREAERVLERYVDEASLDKDACVWDLVAESVHDRLMPSVAWVTAIDAVPLTLVENVLLEVGTTEPLRGVRDSDNVGDNSETVMRRVGVGAGVIVLLGEGESLLLTVCVFVCSLESDAVRVFPVALGSALHDGVIDLDSVTSRELDGVAPSYENVREVV